MDRPKPNYEAEFAELRARIEKLEARDPEARDSEAHDDEARSVERSVSGTQALLFPDERDAVSEDDVSDALTRYGTRLEDLFRKVEDVFGVVTPRLDRLLYLSPSVEALTGLSPEQIYADPAGVLGIVHEDDRVPLVMFFAPDTPERELEFRIQSPAGGIRWLWLRVWKMLDATGVLEQIVLIASDITERKVHEEELREREERYHALSELNSDLNFAVSIRGHRVTEISSGAEGFLELTGYPFEENLPDRWPKWVPLGERERLVGWAEDRIFDKHEDPIETCIITKAGKVRWLQLTMSVREKSPSEVKALVSITDITELHLAAESQRRYADRLEAEVAERTRELETMNKTLRGLQDRLIRAERLRTAEDLAASIAHSINNPLAALRGNLQMMAERQDGDPLLDRTLELGNRIKVVVDRTLTLFRKGTLELGTHHPCDIVDEVERELGVRADANGVTLHSAARKDLPELVVDRALLVSALVSAAENAIDAMPDGGDLKIDASAIPGAEVCRFRVADNGPGIPDALRRKVLEPFFTTKGGGTGLGLAIAQGVVQGHDGRIEIGQSEEGGALVTIEVPIRPGALGTTAGE